MSRPTKSTTTSSSTTDEWISVGHHTDRTALKRTAELLRARWAGRYDFRIAESDEDNGQWELHLRHR